MDDGVLVLRRVHVAYELEADDTDADTIERVHGFHADKCPVARSIGGSVAISTSYTLVAPRGT